MGKKVCSIPPIIIVCSIPLGIIVLLQSFVDNKKVEKAASTLTVHNLNRETGLDVLIEKRDDASKVEIFEDNCNIYLKFTNLKKTTKYVNE